MGRKKQDIVLENVLIESVAAEGKAIARIDGTVLFVPFAVPGDIVDVKVTKKKKNYMEGFILRMVKPSGQRIEPFCSHFGICGGCKWQPLPYSMQLQAKQQQVYDQLVRIGHLEIPEIQPIVGSAKTAGYRNKLEFTFSNRRWIETGEDPDSIPPAERVGLGFHVGRFFDKVLDIRQCHLQPEPSNAIRLFIRQYAVERGLEFFDIRNHTGFLRTMTIRNNVKGDVMLIISFYHEDAGARTALLDAVSSAFPQIKSLWYVINPKANDSIADLDCILYKGDDAIYEEMEGLRFKIGPKSFFQTNSLQALKLYDVARNFANLTGKELVYDLYTGTGTIANFVARRSRKVIGIEYVPEAIEDAKVNASINNIDNAMFLAGDMREILTPQFVKENGVPDVIITDPPRAGMHKDVITTIMETKAKRIVYVSCNPATQARDIALLDPLYKVEAIQPVDMFPQTQHVENVCLLVLKND